MTEGPIERYRAPSLSASVPIAPTPSIGGPSVRPSGTLNTYSRCESLAHAAAWAGVAGTRGIRTRAAPTTSTARHRSRLTTFGEIPHRRLLALAELKFPNSIIEAWQRSLKHQWLFLHSLDSISTSRRLVAFYLDEHNRVRRIRRFESRRLTRCTSVPGRDAVPAGLTPGAVTARRARVDANPIGIMRGLRVGRGGVTMAC